MKKRHGPYLAIEWKGPKPGAEQHYRQAERDREWWAEQAAACRWWQFLKREHCQVMSNRAEQQMMAYGRFEVLTDGERF